MLCVVIEIDEFVMDKCFFLPDSSRKLPDRTFSSFFQSSMLRECLF
ncbi:hypothetical protein PRABACTJOHN_01821 [Parabacteroides johnsonii DSM 18315]|uniref:Uncharacterized protein n=1 Tax=Parabacteroides johnsonii DSM 18315 TaxID=537006 RepID=B7B9W6_9BACT|nr:hypothetical protein PRABACTJOHN_01821 [Parabacteroides johnsonii DSM 18315]